MTLQRLVSDLRNWPKSGRICLYVFVVWFPLNRPVPVVWDTSAKRSRWQFFRLCARSRAPRAWSESLADFATKFAGHQVFATSRCARRDGAEALRVPVAHGRDQRVRRRTENKSASTPSLDASFLSDPRAVRVSARTCEAPCKIREVICQENEWATKRKNHKSP
jgi:hypothetical protein